MFHFDFMIDFMSDVAILLILLLLKINLIQDAEDTVKA